MNIYIAQNRTKKSSDALAAEQKCLESLHKSTDTTVQRLQLRRQAVPDKWTSHRKVSGADGGASPRDVEDPGVGRPQLTSTGD